MIPTYTSTGVRAPWVTEQQTAPAKANLEYSWRPESWGAGAAAGASTLALADILCMGVYEKKNRGKKGREECGEEREEGEESEAIEALQSLGKRGKKMETRKEEDLKGMAGRCFGTSGTRTRKLFAANACLATKPLNPIARSTDK